jgi:hypothetical protein
MAGESARASAQRQREKADRLLRAAALNERGADGEVATALALLALPADRWTVLHDLRWPGRRFANIDHLVVGPPGVFVIDSKNWSGRLTVRDNVLRQNGYRREHAVAGAAEAARAIAKLTSALSPDSIHPVLCFVRDEEVSGRAGDVLLCSTGNVVRLLESRPERLHPLQVRDLVQQLDPQRIAAIESAQSVSCATSPRARLPRSTLARYATRSVSRRRTKRRRNGPRLGRLMVALMFFGVLVFAPQVVTGLGEAVAEMLVSQLSSTK